MQRLATLLLHQKDANLMVVVVCEDIHRIEQIDGGSLIIFRDRSTIKVTEAASAMQTSIDTLWGEYITGLTGV